MTHPTNDLTALLDGALSPERTAEVRAHLRECGACAAAAERLRDALALLGTLPAAPEPSPFFATRLEARLREERPRRTGWIARIGALRWRIAVPALAVAILATTLSIREARGRERAIAQQLELLEDYEVIASLDDVETAEDAMIVADLDELEREGRP